MTILLKKDGRLIIDADQPLEGVSLDNLAAILSGASDGDVIQYDATNGMWVNKTAPSSLPEVTASDKGKYLKANETTGDPEWAEGGSSGGGVLVVTDTDGTLDKTAGEIMAAAESGGACIKQTSGPASYTYPIVEYSVSPSGYGFCVSVGGEATYYLASGENDYPALHE